MKITNFNTLELIKAIGLTKTLSAIIISFCHLYIFTLYDRRLKDRQDEINRLAEENREYRDRFLKLLDQKFNNLN